MVSGRDGEITTISPTAWWLWMFCHLQFPEQLFEIYRPNLGQNLEIHTCSIFLFPFLWSKALGSLNNLGETKKGGLYTKGSFRSQIGQENFLESTSWTPSLDLSSTLSCVQRESSDRSRKLHQGFRQSQILIKFERDLQRDVRFCLQTQIIFCDVVVGMWGVH